MTQPVNRTTRTYPEATVPAPRRWLRELLLGVIIGSILGLLREADASVGPLPSGLGIAAFAVLGLGVTAVAGVVAFVAGSRRRGAGILLVAVVALAVFQVIGLVLDAV